MERRESGRVEGTKVHSFNLAFNSAGFREREGVKRMKRAGHNEGQEEEQKKKTRGQERRRRAASFAPSFETHLRRRPFAPSLQPGVVFQSV